MNVSLNNQNIVRSIDYLISKVTLFLIICIIICFDPIIELMSCIFKAPDLAKYKSSSAKLFYYHKYKNQIIIYYKLIQFRISY